MIASRTGLLAMAVLLAGCATAPQESLMLVEYVESAPPDTACAAMLERAAARDAANGFDTLGRQIEQVHAAPTNGITHDPARSRRLVPAGASPAGQPWRRMDGTIQSLYVDCAARKAYVSRRGGIADVTYWFGPFRL